MAESEGSPGQFDRHLPEQLEIYAEEVQELYKGERKLRRQLEKDKKSLEQRIREITALNDLFQKHLNRRQQIEGAFQEIERSVDDLSSATGRAYSELAERIDSMRERVRMQAPQEELETTPTAGPDASAVPGDGPAEGPPEGQAEGPA